jgi:predicted nucleic acid-binding protein
MGITFDSNFIIDLLRSAPAARAKAASIDAGGGSKYLTAPVLYEILTGIHHRRSKTEAAVFRALASNFAPLAFDDQAARLAAEIRAEFLRLGQPKPGVDVMIAGIALAGDHVLVTRDSDFEAIADSFGLRIEGY